MFAYLGLVCENNDRFCGEGNRNMLLDDLFDSLDVDSDGELSRGNLRNAATRLGWQWHEARLYAVLDLLCIKDPLSRSEFREHLELMATDPFGPFGEILKRAPRPMDSSSHSQGSPGFEAKNGSHGLGMKSTRLSSLLERMAGGDVSNDVETLLSELDYMESPVESTALLLIDLQRSFTCGTWMRSIGRDSKRQVAPIQLAFEKCAGLLEALYKKVECMFTRCPFPPDSYDWDKSIADIVDDSQLYFIKPGNSVLWPPTNGFTQWVENLLERGMKRLVIGGCTLNSCVRVSSIETHSLFFNEGLEVVVDLNLCGARIDNYIRNPDNSLFKGRSPVGAAIRQMTDVGVSVVREVHWA